MSNIFKPLFFAHGFCVIIQRDTSAPFFGHCVGRV